MTSEEKALVNTFFSDNAYLLLPEGVAITELNRFINSFFAGKTHRSETEEPQVLVADMTVEGKRDFYLAEHQSNGSADLQTLNCRHSVSYTVNSAQGTLKSRAQDRGGIATFVLADSRYDGATRENIYLLGGGASSGSGEGGIEPLDPDLRTGMVWDPLDTEAIKFDIYDVAIKGFLPARRPGRGGYLESHPERYSTIRVLNSKGEPIFATTNFTLESIIKPQKERVSAQITFDDVIARFGPERMKVFSFSGKLLDYANFDWMREWEVVWDKFLRGEVLAKNLWRAYILSEGNLYGGYMLSTNIQKTIKGPGVPFSFTMLMTDNVHLPTLTLITAQDEARLEGTGASFKGSPEEFASAMQKLDADLQKGFPTFKGNKGPLESNGDKPTYIEGDTE